MKECPGKVTKLYSVWDNRTEEPLAAYMTARECAHALGIKDTSFRIAVNRSQKHYSKHRKYYIESYDKKEVEDEEEACI